MNFEDPYDDIEERFRAHVSFYSKDTLYTHTKPRTEKVTTYESNGITYDVYDKEKN